MNITKETEAVEVDNSPKKIVDKSINSYYSILLHTDKAMEKYRTRSGMGKQYTTEYQHHYWFITARLELDKEIFDINVPLVMFNYPQSVSSASVNFDLEEVEATSDKLSALAEEKAAEFIDSDIGKLISDSFPVDWRITALGTLHTHPGSLSTFSGTDYKSNPNNPGIVFPLSETDQDTPICKM